MFKHTTAIWILESLIKAINVESPWKILKDLKLIVSQLEFGTQNLSETLLFCLENTFTDIFPGSPVSLGGRDYNKRS